MKYRKLPVEIEAKQWNGLNLQEIIDFVGDKLKYEIIDTAWQVGKGKPYVDMEIITLEGNMKVSEKDYIIKGVNGELYPCKKDIFNKTYKKVKEENFINERAKYIKVSEKKEKQIQEIREVFSNVYDILDAHNSRENSIAITRLEEAQFWAIKGITREED